MARPRKDDDDIPIPRRPPATTPEARENQLIGLATDLVEKKLRNGTATSQEIVHLLKYASGRERLEREKIENENELLRARVKSLASGAEVESLYREAIAAMTSYKPDPHPDDEYNDV